MKCFRLKVVSVRFAERYVRAERRWRLTTTTQPARIAAFCVDVAIWSSEDFMTTLYFSCVLPYI